MPKEPDFTVAVDLDPVYVRVYEAALKRKYSVVASTVDPEFQTVVDEPAAYSDGQPIEPEFDVAPKSVEPAGQKAETKKENV